MKPPDGSAVRIEQLTKVFLTRKGNAVQALQSVDLEVGRGEVVAIIGPSGCGKSSLLRILAGLDKTYEGRVRWNVADPGDPAGPGGPGRAGRSAMSAMSARFGKSRRPEQKPARGSGPQPEDRRGRLTSATVFQSDSTLPWMTVERNVRMGLIKLRLDRGEADERVNEVLRLVGLEGFPKAYPHELSGGMRQRVAIARALATRPQLLLMDEPLAALDAQTRLVMQQELISIWRQTRSSVVYVTHDIEEAVTVADRVVVLSSRPGRIVAVRDVATKSATVTELRREPSFGDLVVELWQMIAGHVGASLSSTGAPGSGAPASEKAGVA